MKKFLITATGGDSGYSHFNYPLPIVDPIYATLSDINDALNAKINVWIHIDKKSIPVTVELMRKLKVINNVHDLVEPEPVADVTEVPVAEKTPVQETGIVKEEVISEVAEESVVTDNKSDSVRQSGISKSNSKKKKK